MPRPHPLLEIYLHDEGYDVADMEDAAAELAPRWLFASIVPGVCHEPDCHAITDRTEPDARANWCHNCHRNTVVSLAEIVQESF